MYFSIITRTFNRKLFLARLAENLLLQSYKSFEWIVVNDAGCLDDVLQIVQKAKKNGLTTKLVDNKVSKGRSYAANIGVQHATGDYVLILDDDDYIKEDLLEKMSYFFANHSDLYGACTCYSQVILEDIQDDQIIKQKIGYTYTLSPIDVSIIGISMQNVPNSGLFIKKSIFQEVGGYLETVNYTEDWAFMTNLLQKTNIGIIPYIGAYISNRPNYIGDLSNTTAGDLGIFNHLSDRMIWQNALMRDGGEEQFSKLLPYFGFIAKQNKEILDTVLYLQKQIQKILNILIKVNCFFKVLYTYSGLKFIVKIFKCLF